MSRKKPRLEFDSGGGGLYDFLPQPAEDDVAVVSKSEETKTLPKEDKSKVIFLDVDGVLRPEGEYERVLVDGEYIPVVPKADEINFNKRAFEALRTIVLNSGASIVLSSEWRRTEVMKNAIGIALRSHGLPQIRAFTTTACKLRPELVKANNTIAFAERRAREIGEWLQHSSDVKAWVVLDDVDLAWGDGVRAKATPLMRSRIVKIHPEMCLTDRDAQEALRILCDPPAWTPEQEAGAERRAARKLHALYPHLKSAEQGVAEIPGLPKPPPRRQGF